MTVEMKSTNRAALCYLAALPFAIVAAFALTGLAFEAAKGTPPTFWSDLLINIAPALAAGLLVYGMAARWLSQRGGLLTGWTAHVIRASSLYLLTLLALIVIVVGWGLPDFWMVAQIPLWTALAALAGIVLDAVMSMRSSPFGARGAYRTLQLTESIGWFASLGVL